MEDCLLEQFQVRNDLEREERALQRSKSNACNFRHCSTISVTDTDGSTFDVPTRSFVERVNSQLVKQKKSRERQLRFSHARTGNKSIRMVSHYVEGMGTYETFEACASREASIHGERYYSGHVYQGQFYLVCLPEQSLPGCSVLAIGKVVEIAHQFGKDRKSICSVDSVPRDDDKTHVGLHVFHIPMQLVENGMFRFAKDTSKWTRADTCFRKLSSLRLLHRIHVQPVPQEPALVFIENSASIREEAVAMGSSIAAMRVPLTQSEMQAMWI